MFSSFGPAFTLLFFWGDRFSKAGLIAAFLAGPIVTVFWVTLGYTDIVPVCLIAPPWIRCRDHRVAHLTSGTATDIPARSDIHGARLSTLSYREMGSRLDGIWV